MGKGDRGHPFFFETLYYFYRILRKVYGRLVGKCSGYPFLDFLDSQLGNVLLWIRYGFSLLFDFYLQKHNSIYACRLSEVQLLHLGLTFHTPPLPYLCHKIYVQRHKNFVTVENKLKPFSKTRFSFQRAQLLQIFNDHWFKVYMNLPTPPSTKKYVSELTKGIRGISGPTWGSTHTTMLYAITSTSDNGILYQ